MQIVYFDFDLKIIYETKLWIKIFATNQCGYLGL
jgi:hypothetical protein